jgi:hypothetical protein
VPRSVTHVVEVLLREGEMCVGLRCVVLKYLDAAELLEVGV